LDPANILACHGFRIGGGHALDPEPGLASSGDLGGLRGALPWRKRADGGCLRNGWLA
jgi:hypothetical protein